MSDYLDALQRVIDETVAPAAADVDHKGRFPQEAVDALGHAGILGLASAAEMGGGGKGMRAAAAVVERVAGSCGSTAMVVLMHYAATALVEAHGPEGTRRAIAGGQHLTTLAFSEAGSRSHFWAPQSSATPAGNGTVRLDARKSWVTSAGEADSYVWSSRPLAAEGPMTLWLVPSTAAGLRQPSGFDGLGLRGNGSTPVTAEGVEVPGDAMLGADGGGLDSALAGALPWFLVLSAAFSLGLMEAVTAESTAHLAGTRLDHLDQSLLQQPVTRLDLARMRLRTDTTRAFLDDTLTALETGRADAMLRVLEVKAAAGEAAIAVTDLAMKVGGGAAFRKEVGIERRFRDARAARVMAPTTDALLDFVGRTIGGLPLLDA
ncbi:MAG: acyl-CoA/acyl-ACP dehydrogenase [Actinobacteria bacterium]|nr:acyl-CoA/acyl-ACP dehydrogenase [Actinomycetota bacterium]